VSVPVDDRHGRARVVRRVVTDFVMAMLAVALAYQFRFHVYPTYIPGGEPPDPEHYLAAAPVVALTVVVVFWLMGAYRLRRGVHSVDELLALIKPMAVAFLVVLAENGLYRGGTFTFSRTTILYWAIVAVALIMVTRYAVRRYEAAQRARGVGVERALLVGWGEAADLLVQRLRMFPEYGYQLVGILADPLERGIQAAGAPVLGEVGELAQVLRSTPVDTAFFALSEVNPNHMLHLIDCCRQAGVEVRILPGMLELVTTRVTGDEINGIPLLQLRHGLEIRGPKTAVKRAFDVVVVGLGLVVIAPLLTVISALIKLTSPGPVLIHQERVGMRGRTFQTHKFRSMRVDAEAETGPVWATAGDERRTTVGKVLRKLSLDELPQLWNIVRGDMSLVGPRPERPNFVTEFSKELPRYCDRHLVRPGLAGWAQAKDVRGQTSVEERLVYDLYYIENWSLAFDIKIILLTLARVWTHKNAY
jgi:exopolysaccharide biosynthesis polyprenyl glycosylphosphotransferase